ncbi:VOC family protein [Paenibacillus sp. GSMTC-2017]|uniref:VOC family protein n=1 Tax=Paenibacillus sp. GSMTC-2017 TaxID=2794350 RepID=UPI0018D84C15|nr:VOC family protein [Paenibacillus sp. GSMTC-2017]MBH5319922.1 VOC family protein [Paenibacillus sp. GSMTC-2017]
MSNKLHPSTRLGEVKLKVSNLDRSLTFYQEVVGLRVLRQDNGMAELTADGETVLLVLEEVPNAFMVPKRSSSGLYHFAILVPTRKDLGLSLRRLLDSGIHIGQADHLVSEALYISDPDGNGIEIYRDRPRADWEYDSQGFVKMASDPIDWDGLLDEAKGSVWQGLSPGTTIGHVHFHVGDLHKAKQFYCDVLGFDVEADLMRQMGALFVGAGRYHHHLGLNLWAGVGAPPVPSNGTGITYFTIVVPNMEELEKTVQGVTQAGYEVEQRTDGWFVKDPSDIWVRLITEQ